MSDSSQLPSGTTPPPGKPRVFRPFAGSSGQGGQSSAAPLSPPTNNMARRSAGPKPFAGAPGSPQREPPETPVHVAVPATVTVEVELVPESPSTHVSDETPTIEHEAWPSVDEPRAFEAIDDAPSLALDEPACPVADASHPSEPGLSASFELEEHYTRQQPPLLPEPAVVAAQIEPVVTQEQPRAPAEEAVFRLVDAPSEHDPLDAPMFIAPRGSVVSEHLVDEVDAAFITAGLPSDASSAAETATSAAAALERIARRLRAGEIVIPARTDSAIASDESSLATVLAALLSNR